MIKYPENPRPHKEDFEVIYFYKAGHVVGKVNANDVPAFNVLRHKNPNAVTERVFDEVGFKAAQRTHSELAAKLREEFTLKLFDDAGVPDNEFTRKLYNMAFENRKGEGYQAIADEFDELSSLWALAVKALK